MAMKQILKYSAALTVLLLSIACNEIEKVGIVAESSVEQMRERQTQSVNVSQIEAKDIADVFLQSNAGSKKAQTKSSASKRVSSYATIREDEQDLMHVFNYEDGGFIIVGATRNYYPILAYSDKGAFVLQNDMGPVDVWLDETKVCIKNSGSLDEATKAQMQNLWARYDGTYVDPTQELLAARRPQTRSTGEDYCWDRIDYLQALYGSQGWTFLPLSQVEDYFTDLGYENEYDAMC